MERELSGRQGDLLNGRKLGDGSSRERRRVPKKKIKRPRWWGMKFEKSWEEYSSQGERGNIKKVLWWAGYRGGEEVEVMVYKKKKKKNAISTGVPTRRHLTVTGASGVRWIRYWVKSRPTPRARRGWTTETKGERGDGGGSTYLRLKEKRRGQKFDAFRGGTG